MSLDLFQLPPPTQPMAGPGGQMSPEWYRFFQQLARWVRAGLSSETVTSTTHTAGRNPVILVNDDTAGGDVTVSLPAAAELFGTWYHIKKMGTTGSVIIDANGSELIDGFATQTIATQYDSLMLASDGTGWVIV